MACPVSGGYAILTQVHLDKTLEQSCLTSEQEVGGAVEKEEEEEERSKRVGVIKELLSRLGMESGRGSTADLSDVTWCFLQTKTEVTYLMFFYANINYLCLHL